VNENADLATLSAYWHESAGMGADDLSSRLAEHLWAGAIGDAEKQNSIAVLVATYRTKMSEERRSAVRSAAIMVVAGFLRNPALQNSIDIHVDWAQFSRRIELFATSRPREVSLKLLAIGEAHAADSRPRIASVIVAFVADSGPVMWEDTWTDIYRKYGTAMLSGCVEGVMRRSASATLRWIETNVQRPTDQLSAIATALPRICRDEPAAVARYLRSATREFVDRIESIDMDFGPFLEDVELAVNADGAAAVLTEIEEISRRAGRASSIEESVRVMADIEILADRFDLRRAVETLV
jgi:hypothetical protein